MIDRYIIPPISKVEKNNLVWREHWVSPFESLWGIFEKFKFANSASVRDIFELFGTNKIRKNKSKNFGRVHRNCIHLSGLDNNLVEPVFIQPLIKSNNNNIEKLFGLLPNGLSHYSYLRNELYFCPLCIRKGFHSLFHQFRLINECPYHQIPLQKRCPNCEIVVPFELTDKFTIEPFRCICGYSFLDQSIQNLLVPDWEQVSLIQIKSKEIKIMVNMTPQEIELLKGCHIPLYLDLDEYPDLLKYILSVIRPNFTPSIKNVHNTVKSTKSIRYLKNFREGKDRKINSKMKEMEFFDELYNSSLATVKKIINNKRKKILLTQHKTCLKRFIERNGKEDSFCPFVLAYEHWVRFIFGYEENIYNTRFKPNRRYPTKLEFGSKQDDPYLTNLYKELSYKVPTLKEEGTAPVNWIFNRLISHLISSNFQNWLSVFQSVTEREIMYRSIPYRVNKFPFPFYILVIPKNRAEPLEFHWWVELTQPDDINQ